MSWKTIQIFITDLARDRVALDAAIDLTRSEGAHLDVTCLGIDYTEPAAWYTGVHALAMPVALEDAARAAASQETLVRDRLAAEDIRWSLSTMTTPMIGLSQLVGEVARFADVVIAPRPYGSGRNVAHESIAEAVLFNAGTSLLLIPDTLPGWSGQRPENIMLAWNDSPEALAAARAALPWTAAAASVNVAIIDPHSHASDRSDPGGRISQLLTRHGARVEVSVLPKTMRDVADTILRQATDRKADLLVMGAYGHSRLREAIIGGATRHVLERATIPVFLRHQ